MINTHNYTWQDDHSKPRQSGSLSGQSCVLDKQDINLLPASIQEGISVSQSCLLTRMRNDLYNLLAKIWLVSVPQSFVRLQRNTDG